MLEISKIAKLITDNETPYIRVKDFSGNMLFEVKNEDVVKSLQLFEETIKSFSDYGRLIVEAATESQYRGNWKNCFTWNVRTGNLPASGGMGAAPSGYVPVQVMELSLQMQKMSFDFQTKLNELTNKETSVFPEIPPSYLIMAKAFGMNVPEGVLAGLGAEAPTKKATVSMTEEEEKDLDKKIEMVNTLVGSICSKVEIDVVIKALQKLDKKLDQDKNFMNTIIAFL